MKTLIFSDSHLTQQFEENKFKYLHHIISSSDQVIINGDFWDGFIISFDQFFNSKWNKLFPLLKKKKTIYIFGNHDSQRLNDLDRIKHFSDIQSMSHTFIEEGKIFTIEHGQRYFPTELNNINANSPYFRRISKFVKFTERIIAHISGDTYQKLLIKNNRKLKKHLPNKSDHSYFIFGHTHSPEVDWSLNFINSGIMCHGLAQYVLIKDGNIEIIKDRYDR
ncbi:hypothetical protein COY16_00450 [Candidatus Roizmanbacteria bacterium CG_4_10_14_0_2_um_filter_39_13]|uniref:Calcineurin-like phosphoesterase domain-containing protein n=1 Tax=Candidatus Roizmanbacteria bacterium CG_4_10_14_0_2_um_filter_39_13 TaxID=1974825 RepID=A0A2M7U1Q4_9BACT|nr:MAG: hypothetical protein COY16_00450 [Candidatus Roizmanbacteria bacterium CG_4_10_14_0_2_um_filter_39_13]